MKEEGGGRREEEGGGRRWKGRVREEGGDIGRGEKDRIERRQTGGCEGEVQDCVGREE